MNGSRLNLSGYSVLWTQLHLATLMISHHDSFPNIEALSLYLETIDKEMEEGRLGWLWLRRAVRISIYIAITSFYRA